MQDIGQSPHNSNLIFAYHGAGRYLSTDNGYNWEFYGMRGFGVNRHEFRWNPFKEGEIWFYGNSVFGEPYLAASRDNGQSFDFGVDLVQLGFGGVGSIGDIAFDKENGLTVYVAINWQLIKSADGGINWITDGFEIPDQGFALSIIEDPRYNNTLYIGGINQLYLTVDGGNTITKFYDLPFDGLIFKLELDLINNQLFIGCAEGIFLYQLDYLPN